MFKSQNTTEIMKLNIQLGLICLQIAIIYQIKDLILFC